MAYEYRKLRGRIVECYRTQGEFAKAIGISENSLSRKLTCKNQFSQKEMVEWSKLLDIPQEEFYEYFFV